MGILNPLTVYRGDYRYLRYKQEVICVVSDLVGDFVYISGERVDDKWTVTKADPEDETKMPAVGVLIEKNSDTDGVIQLMGVCTLFSGLDVTKDIYVLGPSGIQVGLPVIGSNDYVIIQQVGIPISSDRLYLLGNSRTVKRLGELG